MGVDVEKGVVAVDPRADLVGQHGHVAQRHVVAVKKNAVVKRQPLARGDLFADGLALIHESDVVAEVGLLLQSDKAPRVCMPGLLGVLKREARRVHEADAAIFRVLE